MSAMPNVEDVKVNIADSKIEVIKVELCHRSSSANRFKVKENKFKENNDQPSHDQQAHISEKKQPDRQRR